MRDDESLAAIPAPPASGSASVTTDLHRAGLCLLGSLVLIACWDEARARASVDAAPLDPDLVLVEVARAGPYRARRYRHRDGFSEVLELRRDGQRVHLLRGYRLALGDAAAEGPGPGALRMGEDLTGDGVPDLLVGIRSGGVNCCLDLHLVALGDAGPRVSTVPAGRSGAVFAQLDGDPGLELLLHDDAFAYWRSDRAASPMPEVVLRWKAGRYRPAADLMRRPDPGAAAIAAAAHRLRADEAWFDEGRPPVALWHAMLDLIYAGHGERARELLAAAWPAGLPDREVFRADFEAQLASSRWGGFLLRFAGREGSQGDEPP